MKPLLGLAHAADFQVDELEHVRKLKEVLRPLSGLYDAATYGTAQCLLDYIVVSLHNVRQEPIVVWSYWKYHVEIVPWRNLVELGENIFSYRSKKIRTSSVVNIWQQNMLEDFDPWRPVHRQ